MIQNPNNNQCLSDVSTNHRVDSIVIKLYESVLFPQIQFEGVRGDSYLGDIAIDDIKVQQLCGKIYVTKVQTILID